MRQNSRSFLPINILLERQLLSVFVGGHQHIKLGAQLKNNFSING